MYPMVKPLSADDQVIPQGVDHVVPHVGLGDGVADPLRGRPGRVIRVVTRAGDAVVIGGGAAGRIRGARTSPEAEDGSGSAAPQLRPSNAAESRLVEALRAGDEEAFVQLVRLHGPSMLRIARLYTSSRAVAEEVLQETWLGVLTGVGRFEGRSSLRTWLFRILVNKAKTRAASERRSVSFAELSDEEVAAPELSVEADRFRGAGERWAHHWTSAPQRWAEHPEASLLSQETIATVERAAASLPAAQRAVVILRDVVGCDANEVCDTLGITATNQRVLLHRARAKVRRALEQHLASPQP
jgi:RNA polymerase sigma-70 factor (ECF subfamily)